MHAAMSGTFGKNFLDPDFVWGFRTVRLSSSRRTRRCCYKFPKKGSHDTAFYLPPAEQQSLVSHKFAGGKGLGGSSRIKFYVLLHDIDSVIEFFSDHQ
jgi:hypothetical protein